MSRREVALCRMWGDLSRLALSYCHRHRNLALLEVWHYMELWFFLDYFLLEESREENKERVLVIVKQTRVCERFVFFWSALARRRFYMH